LPLLITEIAIGRRGKASAPQSFINVAVESGRGKNWGWVGTLGIFCAFVILSYYTVLSGWTLDYFVKASMGAFAGVDADATSAMFDSLLGSPAKLMFWNTLVHILIILVIRQGVQSGIERAVKILMPALFGAILVMVIYGMVAGDMASTLKFLLEPDFSKITFGTVMKAIGQAFFSIGIGMGSLVVFGSYMPKDFSIGRSATYVILMDTGVAVLAGFAIFPLVFQYGLNPGAGAGLVFQTLPLAFGQMPGGQLFGAVFFVLLISAALSSCMGLAEGVVNWVDEHLNIPRKQGIFWVAGAGWILGIASILGFSTWSEVRLLDFIPSYVGLDIFDTLDTLAANNLLLIGGDGLLFSFWRLMIRFVIPPILIVTLIMGITEAG